MKRRWVLSALHLVLLVTLGCQEPHNVRMRWAASIPEDDQRLIGVDAEQRIVVCDRESRAILQTVGTHKAGVRALRVHPAGTHVATLGEDGRCILWSLERPDAHLAFRVSGAGEDAGAMAFSPDGRHIFLGGTGSVAMHAVQDGHIARLLPDPREPELYVDSNFEEHEERWSEARILSLDVQPDQSRLLVGTDNGMFLIDYVHSRMIWDLMAGDRDPVVLVRYTPEGDGFFIARRSGNLEYYSGGRKVQAFRPSDLAGKATSGHYFTAMAFNRNGQWFALLGTDGIFRAIQRDQEDKVWRLVHRSALEKLDVNGIALDSEGENAWVGSQGNVERFTRIRLPDQLRAKAITIR